MDAPDEEWFARHNAPDGSWTGPGVVVRADYHYFDLVGADQVDATYTFKQPAAEVSARGNVAFMTICAMGSVVAHLEVVDEPPSVDGDCGWDAHDTFVLPVADPALGFPALMGGGPPDRFELPIGDYLALVRRASWDAEYDGVADAIREFFLIQLWPTGSRSESDRVLRQRAEAEAAAQQREQERQDAWHAQVQEEHRRTMWRGIEPPSHLETAGPHASQVPAGSYSLALAVAETDVASARAITVWAIEAVAELITDPTSIDFTQLLAAIRSGSSFPAPFDTDESAQRVLEPPQQGAPPPRVEIIVTQYDGAAIPVLGPIWPNSATCAAIREARAADPIAAALGALARASGAFADRDAFWHRAEAAFDRLR